MENEKNFFGYEKISKILIKIAPPVMLSQLIQALYNIVDSLFIGKYSESGLTALSIAYPIQLLMIALAVGTGVGINTSVAYNLGLKRNKNANEVAGTGTPLAVVMWALFALVCYLIMPAYAKMSTDSQVVIDEVVTYGRIVCIFSLGLFAESIWTKVIQANADMKTPMFAQIIGAIVNIILDPVLIFGAGDEIFGISLPFGAGLGVKGAAIATVVGQFVAAFIVLKKGYRKSPKLNRYPKIIKNVYKLGMPNILMQSAYTFYIFGLNLILSTFSDQAVTALGLYYKWQTIFFIPLGALQTCIVPVISYNYASRKIERCKKILSTSVIYGMILMFIGTLCFEIVPSQMLGVFTRDQEVIAIGTNAFHFIGVAFIPMVTSLIFPVFFQAIGYAGKSSILTFVRTLVLFVPLGYLFAKIGGLHYFWLTFPTTEVITTIVGIIFYKSFIKRETKIEQQKVIN